MSALVRAGAASALALSVFTFGFTFGACSSSPGTAYPIYRPSDASATTPLGPSTSTGNPDVNLGTPNGTPAIMIISPNGNPLGVNAPIDVDAVVTVSGAGATDVIDPQSVTATIALMDVATSIATVPLIGGMTGDHYVGKLPVVGLKTGKYTITVTAKTSANQVGSSSVTASINAGPLITVISPSPGQHYKGSIVVLVAIDPGAFPPAQNVQVQIGAMPVALKATTTPGLYRAVFDLTMPTPLVGEQLIIVSVQDSDKPPETAQVKFTFVVDVVGPTITATTPAPGDIVGGVIRLSAKISDDAGVDESSLQVLIGDNNTTRFRLPLAADSAGLYSVLFDTNNLTKCGLKTPGVCIVRPTISFRASDNLGNETTLAYGIAVDNFPPIADLSPPKIRVSKYDEGFRCSIEFDPLDYKNYDGDVPSDLCQVPQLFDLRARIQDDGNPASGVKAIPISTVDENATAVYVLDTVTYMNMPQPLVVDTDGDGFCDDLNPKLEPTTAPLTGPKQVLKVRLKPVPKGGAGDFYAPDYQLPGQPATLPSPCIIGKDSNPPLDLCEPGPQPTIAINYIGLPAIWAIEPIAPDNADYCFGSQLDTRANNILPPTSAATAATGWKCIAIVTADKVGNHSTSAPLRVYLPDYDNGGSKLYCPMVPAAAGPPPSCTGTYDRATGMVSQKACLTRNFSTGGTGIEVCYGGDCGGSIILN